MPAVDVGTLRKLEEDMGGDPAIMRDLIETFLREAPRQLAGMGEAAASGTTKEVNRLAHSMRSTSATFGAARLSELCRGLEASTLHAMPAGVAEQVHAVEEEWARTRGELETWLARGGG